MKKIILFFTALVVSLTSISCSKDEQSQTEPPNTSLELIIKDDTENNLSNAAVKLFSSEIDLNNRTNQIGATLLSDVNGIVTFNNLSSIAYYWIAEKDCKNNLNNVFSTNSVLISNTNNTIISALTNSATGTIRVVNSSNNTYHIRIDFGSVEFDLNANSSFDVNNLVPGTHYVERTSPTLIFNSYVNCNSTTTVEFF